MGQPPDSNPSWRTTPPDYLCHVETRGPPGPRARPTANYPTAKIRIADAKPAMYDRARPTSAGCDSHATWPFPVAPWPPAQTRPDAAGQARNNHTMPATTETASSASRRRLWRRQTNLPVRETGMSVKVVGFGSSSVIIAINSYGLMQGAMPFNIILIERCLGLRVKRPAILASAIIRALQIRRAERRPTARTKHFFRRHVVHVNRDAQHRRQRD